MWNTLFQPPYAQKIEKVLPVLFNIVELENRRGNKLGMEVGTARERVLIALFMYVYGNRSVEFPPSTSPELDIIVKGHPLSIKTKSSKGFTGIKLIWTVDWQKVHEFARSFAPQSDLLYVNIVWNADGGFFLIPKGVQNEILERIGRTTFMKLPSLGTNPRGVELSAEALRRMTEHKETLSLVIHWRRDPSLLVERALYGRWIDLWDTLG